ncbi:hypothetical protein TWF718_000912 [Orbilia javanica]|uniref:DNA polymerase delta subunit 4 n=1 Tax=Orbilia javanica TaxID=47235 RepID=A0AAN8N4V6_9PEZI
MPASTQSKLNFAFKKNVQNQKATVHDIPFRASTTPSKVGEDQKALAAEKKGGAEEQREKEDEGEGEEEIETVAGDSARDPVSLKSDGEHRKEQQEVLLFQEEFIQKPEPGLGVGKKLSDQAYKITHRQIRKYSQGIENSRIHTAVHQVGLAEYEKILRHFDLSSQYGPCVGVTRFKRWERAERLGLGPPIEVLAVLLKVELGEGVEEPPEGWEPAPIDAREDIGSVAHIDQLIATHTE